MFLFKDVTDSTCSTYKISLHLFGDTVVLENYRILIRWCLRFNVTIDILF